MKRYPVFTTIPASSYGAQRNYTVSYTFSDTNAITDFQIFCYPFGEYLDALKENLWDHSFVFSPIKWQNNRRKSQGFVDSSSIVLDFDDSPVSLDMILGHFSGFAGAIYTTKSHQVAKNGIVSDRFRLILATSRAIRSSDEWIRICRYFNLHFLSCPGTSNAAAMFRLSIPGAKWFSLGGSLSVDIDSLLLKCPELPPPLLCPSITLNIPDVEENRRNGIGKFIKDTYFSLTDRRYKGAKKSRENALFTSIYRCLRDKSVNISQIKAVLLGWSVYRDFIAKNSQHTIEGWIEKALPPTILLASKKTIERIIPVNPKMPVKMTKTDALESDYLSMLEKQHRQLGIESENDAFTATYSMFQRAIRSENRRLIVSAPCGTGKSLGSYAWIASKYAPDNRFFVIKDTIKGAYSAFYRLIRLGVSHKDIGFLHSYSIPVCKRRRFAAHHFLKAPIPYLPSGHTNHNKMYDRKNTPCQQCPAAIGRFGFYCPFYQQLFQRDKALQKPIVIITHSRTSRYIEAGLIPSDATLVIDEAIKNYENLSIDGRTWARIMPVFPFNIYQEAEKQIGIEYGSKKIVGFLGDSEVVDILKSAKRLGFNDNDFALISSIAHFFKGKKERFVVRVDSKSLEFTRKTIDFPSIHNRIVILDASASVSPCVFEGFTILKAKEHKKIEYGKMELFVQQGFPSKNHIERIAPEYLIKAREFIGKTPHLIFLASNKGMEKMPKTKRAIDDFRKKVAKNGSSVTILTRGSIVGSNEVRDSDTAVIVMSEFSTIADIVLKTSLIEGKEVNQDRIMKMVCGKWRPRINRRGFEDPGLNDVARRLQLDETYQILMRTRARKHQNEQVKGIIVGCDLSFILALRLILPGVYIDGCGPDIEFYQKLRDFSIEDMTVKLEQECLKWRSDRLQNFGVFTINNATILSIMLQDKTL